MPDEALALVRRIYDAWDREESARDFIAEDVEYVNPPYAVESGTRRGRRSFGIVRGTYEDFEIEVERCIDAGGGVVVVLAHYTATGAVSGVPLAGEHGYVWTVRDGLAVRFCWFQSHREALAEAGLDEERNSAR
jgi:ketosteroid isomerase-like protein